MLQFTKDDVMYVIELGVMMLLGLVVLFMVVRPLVKRILASEEVAAAHRRRRRPCLTDEQRRAGATARRADARRRSHPLIDVAQVQGQVHAQSVHRVGELAERNPNETVAIVRQWLDERSSPRDLTWPSPQTANANDITSVIANLAQPSERKSPEGAEDSAARSAPRS